MNRHLCAFVLTLICLWSTGLLQAQPVGAPPSGTADSLTPADGDIICEHLWDKSTFQGTLTNHYTNVAIRGAVFIEVRKRNAGGVYEHYDGVLQKLPHLLDVSSTKNINTSFTPDPVLKEGFCQVKVWVGWQHLAADPDDPNAYNYVVTPVPNSLDINGNVIEHNSFHYFAVADCIGGGGGAIPVID